MCGCGCGSGVGFCSKPGHSCGLGFYSRLRQYKWMGLCSWLGLCSTSNTDANSKTPYEVPSSCKALSSCKVLSICNVSACCKTPARNYAPACCKIHLQRNCSMHADLSIILISVNITSTKNDRKIICNFYLPIQQGHPPVVMITRLGRTVLYYYSVAMVVMGCIPFFQRGDMAI